MSAVHRFDMTQDQLSRRVDSVLFLNTCAGYPEQYDIYLDGKQIGYFRMRHGSYSVTCPDVLGKSVLRVSTGDNFGHGEFDTEEERSEGLAKAAVACLEWALENPDRLR
jgi:hypothetical protein